MVITVLCGNKTVDITPDKMANENALLSKDTDFNIMIVPNYMAGFIRLHFNHKSMLQSSQYGSAVRWIHQNYMSDWCKDCTVLIWIGKSWTLNQNVFPYLTFDKTERFS